MRLKLLFVASALVLTFYLGEAFGDRGLGSRIGVASSSPDRRTKVVILLRHAEKANDDPVDPKLTKAGHARAQHLARLLERVKVDHLITSELKRTRQTAEPLRKSKGLKLDFEHEAPNVIAAVNALPPGSTTVVVHHSHAVQDILRGLGVDAAVAKAVDPEVFDHLFILTLHPDIETRLVDIMY